MTVRKMRFLPLWAWLCLLAACGNVSVEQSGGQTAADGFDSGQSDAVGSADTGLPADAGATADVPVNHPAFKGSARVGYMHAANGPPANLRQTYIAVEGAAVPDEAHTYVLWLTTPDGKPTFAAVLPRAAEFLHESPLPPPGTPSPFLKHSGAMVSWEAAAGAELLQSDPGPIVWQGTLPPAVWAHAKHVLAENPSGAPPGFAQMAAIIAADMAYHAGLGLKMAKEKKYAAAGLHAEHTYNLAVEKAANEDINGNKKIDNLDQPHPVGLYGKAGRAVDDAVYHANAAIGADTASPTQQIAASNMKECADLLGPDFDKLLASAKAAAAPGGQSVVPFEDLKAVADLVVDRVACVTDAALGLAEVDLALP